MEYSQQEITPSGLGVNEVLFMLFRHKWKIALCALAGFAAAGTVYFLSGRDYESRAKLLVRYVLERSAIDPAEQQVKPLLQSDTLINTEVEILTSVDLAVQVANSVGVERFVHKAPPATGKASPASPSPSLDSPVQSVSPDDKAAAIRSIITGMKVEATKGSNVIIVSYKNRDPELARDVLESIVTEYQHEHLDVHRSLGAFAFVDRQATQVRNDLAKTEEALSKQKAEAGIISLAESTANINARRTRIEEALLGAESESAEQEARVKEMERQLTGGAIQTNAGEDGKMKGDDGGTKVEGGKAKGDEGKASASELQAPPAPADKDVLQRYQLLADEVAQLSKNEVELLSKFTPENQSVKSVRRQIEYLNRERRELEQKFPTLLAVAPKAAAASAKASGPDIVSERADLAAVVAKIATLKAQLKDTQEKAIQLANLAPEITRLERKKDTEETNLKYIESSLQKANTDEALGKDGKTSSDISVVQNPTSGAKVTGQTQKIVLGLAGGGLGLGIGIALLIELVLNRSIRRPLELETRLRIPQMLSIPYFPDRPQLQLQSGSLETGDQSGSTFEKSIHTEIAPWDVEHFIRSFSEEIRDRLILSFRLKNLTHKPKLVGIAGLSGGEGASTLAGSLAATLSETGDGKVLLVDLNASHSAAHPFFNGRPACGLIEALEANGDLPPIADNLYLASGISQYGGSMQLAAKRFYALIPTLKASHFDYIIFDMPPVNQGSATLAIAGCLDKLLFVVEAEKSDRDEVKRAYAELIAAKADVAGILNKTRSSGPKWLNA